MAKKTIDDIDVRGKRVLLRLDLNVPLDNDGCITDDHRIRTALPTVKKLLAGGARVILMSHLGRPTGDPDSDKGLSLSPVAARLTDLLGQPVTLVPEIIGPNAVKTVTALTNGQCCLLENLRFNEAETIKDKNAAKDPDLRAKKDEFAAKLAEMGDVYVNDAFGTCHRDNASMLTVPQKMTGKPCVMGYLVEKELRFLGKALNEPKRPFVAVVGGAKVSDKVGAIEALLDRCDEVLIGGAMGYTFAAAEGIEVGRSLVEPNLYATARRLKATAGGRLRTPIDSVAAAHMASAARTQVCIGAIPGDLMGLDIGPKTIAMYCDTLRTAGTVFWNGPMGVFETPPFDVGTMAVARAIADATARGAITVVGGGDSGAALDKAGLTDCVSHMATGGGASLEFLEGRPFAAIGVLDDR